MESGIYAPIRNPMTVPRMTFRPVNAPSVRRNPTTNTNSVDEDSTDSKRSPTSPNTSKADKNQPPESASQPRQSASTTNPMRKPESTTARKYAADGIQRGMGADNRSLRMPRVSSCTITPHAHSGTVMPALAITPESIQQSAKERISSSAPVTPIPFKTSRRVSVCVLPRNRTYRPSTMSGASRAKKMFALSLTKIFKLRSVCNQSILICRPLPRSCPSQTKTRRPYFP